MKRPLLFAVLIVMMGMQSSCITKNTLPESNLQQSTNLTIPLDDAIGHLDAFLNRNEYMTRGLKKSYRSIEVVSSGDVTRSNGESLPIVDSLLYLVNFEDDAGYAILSADRRIGTPILAVTEMGSISAQDFDLFSQNTTRFEGGTLGDGGDDLDDGGDDDLPNDFIVEFVNGQLGDGYNNGGLYEPPTNNGPTYWVAPLLTTIWGQKAPYNLKCPEENGKPTLAGCVAIAIGQMVAYFEADCSQLENTYNWTIIKSVGKMEDWRSIKDGTKLYTPIQQEQVATLIREIGDMCCMNYDEDNSTTVPWKIDNCLNCFSFEYSDFYWGYDIDDITNSLHRGYPVIISAGQMNFSGHTWVIDGYDSHYNPYGEENRIVHCNWGWNGLCNGFYYTGVFDTRESAVIHDTDYGDIEDVQDLLDNNYTWMFSSVFPDYR